MVTTVPIGRDDMSSANDDETEELRDAQAVRERTERERAEQALDESERREHERRSEKAGYLREKLEQRLDSERDSDA
jgi:hypothetical protein